MNTHDISKESRIWVTGGTGFLGKHVLNTLSISGYKNIIGTGSNIDLCNRHTVDNFIRDFNPDVVIHLAAYCGGIGANNARPGEYFYKNILMGINVIDACRKFNIKKLVLVGTVCSYPSFTPIPFKESSLWDGYPEPTNAPYGVAKLALYEQAKAYRAQFGLNSVYLLPANLYGPGDNFSVTSSHVIPALIRKFCAAVTDGLDTISVWGDGSPSRDFLHVDDAARAIVLAMANYNGADPVNIGTGIETSISSIVKHISEIVGFNGKVAYNTFKPNGQQRRCLDVSRAKAMFRFTARIPFIDGLREVIQWWEDNKGAIIEAENEQST